MGCRTSSRTKKQFLGKKQADKLVASEWTNKFLYRWEEDHSGMALGHLGWKLTERCNYSGHTFSLTFPQIMMDGVGVLNGMKLLKIIS